MGKLMTIIEVAERLNVSASTLRYLVQTGSAPRSLKVGRRRMFRPEDVDAYIDEQLAKETI
jgi:excisionase family DNA binding protein